MHHISCLYAPDVRCDVKLVSIRGAALWLKKCWPWLALMLLKSEFAINVSNFMSRNHCETSRLRSASLGVGVANSAKPRQIVLTSSIPHDCCTLVLHFDHRPSNWITFSGAASSCFFMVTHSSRTDSTEEGRRKLVSIGRAKIPLPLSTQAFQFPQSLQDIGAIVPRSQESSLLQEQLDGILGRKVVTHNKLGTQNASAAIDASKAVEKHMHGFSVGHRFHGLFPQRATNHFPLFQARIHQSRNSFNPTVHRLQCDVFQVALDVEDSMLFKIAGPIFRSPLHLHFMRAHGHDRSDLQRQSLRDGFQATRCLHTSKQHRRLIRRLVDQSSIQRPVFYTLEAVIVLRSNSVQISPAMFVGIGLPDISLSRRSPLASAVSHSDKGAR